jgi:phage gp36-like protein
MRYISITHLQRAIPGQTLIWLSQDDPAASEPDMAVIEDAVRNAEEIVDGYIATRYALPLTNVPTVLADIVVSLARHWLYARRPEGTELPEAVTSAKKGAMALLKDIQMGNMALNIAQTSAPQPDAGRMEVASRLPMFGQTTLEQW